MKKIVIVDDDPSICDSLSMLLEDYGYTVRIISDKNELQTISIDPPDLILLDIWLSGYDGRTVCRELKTTENTRHIPVIMMSASRELVQTVKDAGAEDFVAKPFQTPVLINKINSFIQ